MVVAWTHIPQDSLLHQGRVSTPECGQWTTQGSTIVDPTKHTVLSKGQCKIIRKSRTESQL